MAQHPDVDVRTTTVDALRAGFRDPDRESAPMVRWWWFGPHVERARLSEELDTIARAGYGGVEVSVVYPLAAETDRYLSAGFLDDLRFAAEESRSRNLRFDITLGSGWSFGGPHIDQRTAARGIHRERHEVGPAGMRVSSRGPWPGDEIIAAFVGDGSIQEPPEEFEQLQVVDDHIVVPDGKGPRVVLLLWSRLTGQNVKRAAAGAEGPVLDHYSADAAQAHIAAVCEPLLDAVPADLVGSVFCDSVEVYGADWTQTLPAEFRSRRGYDPAPKLWMLEADTSPARAFRRDFYGTLAELYEENFVARLRAWAARRGVPFRIQSYGEPPAGISSYRSADCFEGEGWGWTEITQTRWASSAGQIYGRSVVSSEIWTWVHSPSFRATPLDLKGELHEHLLLGVNHFIGHGWPYRRLDTEGLGWIFYAAGALDDRNPWWPAASELTRYVHRLSWLLRRGERVSDVGLYAPYGDVYAQMGTGKPGDLNLWAGVKRHVGDDIPRTVRVDGYDFDLFDDDAVEVLDPARFRVVVLPSVSHLPDGTSAWLQRAREAGTRVVRVGGTVDVGEAVTDLEASLRAACQPPLTVRSPAGESTDAVGTLYRRIDDVDVYLIANTGPRVQGVTVTMRSPRDVVERWDPGTGEPRAQHRGSEPVEMSLHPYEAALLVAFDGAAAPVPMGQTADPTQSLERTLSSPWAVRFGDEESDSPVAVPHRWEDTPERAGYSGSATYTTTVHLDESWSTVTLDLGDTEPDDLGGSGRDGVRGRAFRADVATPVGVVAEVAVNGRAAGVVWHPPYEIEIGHLLRAGASTVTITVHNTAANALADDATVRAAAQLSRDLYGRRFRMQDIERARDDVSSGLLRTPRLRITR